MPQEHWYIGTKYGIGLMGSLCDTLASFSA